MSQCGEYRRKGFTASNQASAFGWILQKFSCCCERVWPAQYPAAFLIWKCQTPESVQIKGYFKFQFKGLVHPITKYIFLMSVGSFFKLLNMKCQVFPKMKRLEHNKSRTRTNYYYYLRCSIQRSSRKWVREGISQNVKVVGPSSSFRSNCFIWGKKQLGLCFP